MQLSSVIRAESEIGAKLAGNELQFHHFVQFIFQQYQCDSFFGLSGKERGIVGIFKNLRLLRIPGLLRLEKSCKMIDSNHCPTSKNPCRDGDSTSASGLCAGAAQTFP